MDLPKGDSSALFGDFAVEVESIAIVAPTQHDGELLEVPITMTTSLKGKEVMPLTGCHWGRPILKLVKKAAPVGTKNKGRKDLSRISLID